MRWLALWVVASLIAFLSVAPWGEGGGTLVAPVDGEDPGGIALVLGVQLVVAVSVSVAVLTRRSRRHSF